MRKHMYDYLIVGTGLFGAVFAYEAKKKGKECLVIDRRPHIAGNAYTKNIADIEVHMYGAHIFHTSNREVWEYVQQFAEFNRYTNSPLANFCGEIYSMPFNMYTFNKMWGVTTSAEAKKIVFTGMIDEYFDYQLGELEYRGLRFETQTLDIENYQGNAVVNYTDRETPFT